MSLSTLLKLDEKPLLSKVALSLVCLVCLIDVGFCASASEASSFDAMRRGATDGDGGSSVFQGDSFSFFEQLASSLDSHHVVSVGMFLSHPPTTTRRSRFL